MSTPTIPDAPRAIQKGVPLKALLDQEAVQCLAQNIVHVYPHFDTEAFCQQAMIGLEPLSLMQRGTHIAKALKHNLPQHYAEAIDILIASMTPAQTEADAFGLATMFYLPHSAFIAEYGQDAAHNKGQDPFECSMSALHALTMRFTSEFAIRPFLIQQQTRTLAALEPWLEDPNPHVRRLCSEGTRPKLPWGKRIPAFIANPQPTLPILDALKNDESLYVRRSVANHLGDIAKDHPEQVYQLCESWLQTGASKELQWAIRHAVRHPAKKGDARALAIREAAKGR